MSILFYIVLIATHCYLYESTAKKIVDFAVGVLHGIFGSAFAFYIMYKGYYGVLLSGPCWLFYKVLEAAYTSLRNLISLYLLLTSIFESSWNFFSISRSKKTDS